MLRLHNIDSNVILIGLLLEITDYARFANEGKQNEHSYLLGDCVCNAFDTEFGLLWPKELLVRPRCAMRHMSSKRPHSSGIYNRADLHNCTHVCTAAAGRHRSQYSCGPGRTLPTSLPTVWSTASLPATGCRGAAREMRMPQPVRKHLSARVRNMLWRLQSVQLRTQRVW